MLERLTPGRAAVGGHRFRDRRAVGQLSADLFAGRPDQLRGAAVSRPWRVASPMSRLIVISNRVLALPKPPAAATGAQGGLAVALAGGAARATAASGSAGRARRPSEFTGQIDIAARRRASPPRRSTSRSRTSTNIITATPTGRSGRCSTTGSTWPNIDRSFAGGYERVNERFADTVLPLIEPDDLIWVHDYHLIPLGQRAAGARGHEPDRLLPPHPLAAHAAAGVAALCTSGWSARCSPTT